MNKEKKAQPDKAETLLSYYNIMTEHNIYELEIESKDLKIRLKRWTPETEQKVHIPFPIQVQKTVEPKEPEPQPETKYHKIVSPIAGTFYRSPAPSAPPFVKEGDIVNVGKVLCIIEAMKVMNEIKSDIDGKVVKILVENQKPVTVGQELILIQPT